MHVFRSLTRMMREEKVVLIEVRNRNVTQEIGMQKQELTWEERGKEQAWERAVERGTAQNQVY